MNRFLSSCRLRLSLAVWVPLVLAGCGGGGGESGLGQEGVASEAVQASVPSRQQGAQDVSEGWRTSDGAYAPNGKLPR